MEVAVNGKINQKVLKQLSVVLHQNPYKDEKAELCLNIYVFRPRDVIFLVLMGNLIKCLNLVLVSHNLKSLINSLEHF